MITLNHLINKSKTMRNVIYLKSLMIIVTVFISNSIFAQTFSRTTIWSNATPYSTFTWSAAAENKWSGTYCSGRYVYAPTWVVVGTNTGMPYGWGQWNTTTGHISLMSSGKSAGDNCSLAGGGCTGLGTATGCAGGQDCSGFVSRAWAMATKYSTTTLPDISTAYWTLNQVQKGDILNKSGDHTRLVDTYNAATGYTTVLESSSSGWKVKSNSYSAASLASYSPRYPNKLCSTETPTSIVYTTLTPTAVTLKWKNVSKNYNIRIKKSYIPTWTNYTGGFPGVTFAALTPSTSYNFQVQAKCGVNLSAWSTTYTFTTPAFRIGEDFVDLSEFLEPIFNYQPEELGSSDFQNNSQIFIYPNPVSRLNSLQIENFDDFITKVKIYNVEGSLVKVISNVYTENHAIDMIEFEAGFYLIDIYSSNGTISRNKLIVD